MPTLNDIGQLIAYRVGKPDDHAIIEQAKLLVKAYRAQEIRRSFDKSGRVDRQHLQAYNVLLEKVDKADTCVIDIGCDVLRTKNPVARPVRRKDVPFKYVGEVGGGDSFGFTELEELRYREHNRYTSKAPVYTYINDYIYVYNTNKRKYLRIEGIFDNPADVIDYCDSSCYTDDMEFPLALDLVTAIVIQILKNEFRVQVEDGEINFDKD